MSEQDPLNEIFSRIYDNSEWGGSGPGSAAQFTIEYRAFLQRFIALNGIKRIVDIGCGDWQSSKFMDFDFIEYIGLDVVHSVIEANNAKYGRPNIRFGIMPSDLSAIPPSDLLIIKDVFQHLPNDLISEYLTKIIPKHRFSLISNSYRKEQNPVNADIVTGGFRCIDLTLPPFSIRMPYVFEFNVSLVEVIRTILIVGQ